MAHAIAEAGKTWGNAEDKSWENAEKIAHDAVKNEDMFLDKAGTRELVERYNNVLIERSYALDTKEGKEKGTHLKAYLDDVADAVQGVDFEKVKKRDLSGLNGKTLNGIKAEISASAKKNIGMDGALEEDFLKTLKEDAGKAEDQQVFKGAKVDEPQAMGGGLIQLIMMFIGALLGIDVSAMMGGNSREAEQKLAENHLSFSPALEEKLNNLIPAATRLHEGKATAADLQTVNDFAGVKEADRRELSAEEKQALGGQILDDVTKLRSGQVTEKDVGAHILETYKTKGGDPEKNRKPQPKKDEKEKSAPSPEENIAQTLALAAAGPVGFVAVATANVAKSIDWDQVAAYVENMPKSKDAPAAPLLTDAGSNVHRGSQSIPEKSGGRQ